MSWFFRFLFGESEILNVNTEVQKLIDNDPEISNLHKQVNVPVLVEDCGDEMRACYRIATNEIVISPKICDRDSIREALLHELTHAHDHLINGIELNKIRGLAISEVHAMKRCECRDMWFRRICTKQQAIHAVALASGKQELAEKTVVQIFNEAYDGYNVDEAVESPPFEECLTGPFEI